MIFKQETIKSWFTGIRSSMNNEVINPFQNAEQVIWKYNQAIEHNSLTLDGWNRILTQADDGLKMYLTSIKGTTASMTGYTTSLQGNIIGYKKVSSVITQYNSISSTETEDQTTFANAVSTTNTKLGAYLAGLKGAKASLGGYVLSLVGTTAKTIALQLATVALNSAITIGASLIISGIVSAISSWIHKTENMISASENALDTIKTLNNTLKDNQKTVSNTAKRFAELSQGVDQLTGKNISLTNDDYEEFLNLSNHLAEIFPTLTRIYNDNGDAIVQLNGNVDTIVGSLHNLSEAQRELANKQIAEDLPTIFDGLSAKSNAYKSELEDLEDKKNALLQGLENFTYEGLNEKIQTGLSEKYFEIASNDVEEHYRLLYDYIALLDQANLKYEINYFDPIWNGKYDNDGNQILTYKASIYINSSDEEIEKAKSTIDDNIEVLSKQYETDIQKFNEEIKVINDKNKANWNNLNYSLFAWLSTDDSFKVMDDTMQATVQNIVNNLDWSSLDFSSWNNAKQYIQDNILSLINTTNGKQALADIQVMFGIKTQFNNGDISVKDYQNEIQKLLTSIEGFPAETQKSVMWLFGVNFEDDGSTSSDTDMLVNNVKEKLQDEFDNRVDELKLDELQIAAEQIEVSGDNLLSWDELIAKIKEAKEQADHTAEVKTFEDAWADSFTVENDSVKELGNTLLELAGQGRLTIKTFTEADSTKYFKNLGISADEAVVKINKLVDESTQLSSMSSQISEIASALGTKQTDGFVSTDTLSGFAAEIRGLKSWDQFQAVLGSTASSYEECQKAANALASEWVRSNNFLAQLTERNKDYYETQLKAMGVENTSEVISDVLSAKKALVLQEQILAAETEAAANKTDFSINKFLAEAGATEIVRACLFQLVTAEQVFNNSDLNTVEKIEKLKELANAYGQIAIATRIANMEKASQDGHIPIDYEKELTALQNDINNAVGSVQIDFNRLGGGTSQAASAGKSAAESYIEAFEEELSDLSQLRDNGVITEKEYLDSLRALYEKYFENKLGYEKEYAKYQRQYLEGYKSLYESALSGISTLLDNQIDGYKDAKDAAVSSLTDEKEARLEVIDAQKEQLEAQKDLIDEQIEAKQKLIDDIQDEIDAMKDANAERQRQIDLQKAQYELERMQHQRTILQYSESGGMQYVQDDEGLRTAKENVDNAKLEIEISNKEKNISLLEDEISLLEAQKDAIQNQMDLLDKQAEQVESYYSKMISETEAYYDSLISNMEKQKSKWEEIAEIESIARAYSDLEQVAGGMGYSVQDILSGNEQAFEDFKSRYIALLSDLNNNSSFSEGLSYATSGIAQDIDNLEASAATVSESTDDIAANIGEINANAETLSGSLSNINNALSGFSETDNITAAAGAFSRLGQAIQSVADALNISKDGTIDSLTGALKSLCEIPLCETEDDGKSGGILSKFQALKTAVTDVTSAISGGGSSASANGDASVSSSPSMSSGASGGSSGGLVGAIDSLKSAANDALGGSGSADSEEQSEGSGIIAQFDQLKNAVTDTTEAIGSGDSKQKEKSKGNSKNGNLISSITSLGSTTAEILTGDGKNEDKSGGVIGRFEQFKDVIGEANEHVTGIAEGLSDIDGETVECTIKVNIEQNGELPSYAQGALGHMKLESSEYHAKYGSTFAKGTGNYKGLPHAEKNALRSEYGQPELTVYPNGTTELTTQPVISDLPKGTVIFNETQTKKIFQNKPDHIGNTYADGSSVQNASSSLILTPAQRPSFLVEQELQEECLTKTGSIVDKILSPITMMSYNMKEMTGLLRNINHINHNGQNQSVNVGDINISCPGITSQEVARQVGAELNHIFSGFHNYADQQSRIR